MQTPNTSEHNGQQREHLLTILRDLSTVMMISSPTGSMLVARGRPMAIAKVGTDGSLYFLTSEATQKIDEILRSDVGLCTGQSKTHYVTLLGRFSVAVNESLITELWSSTADAWFPGGKHDPSIRVVVFRPTNAELWDIGGAKGVGYLVDLAKAWITNTPPKTDDPNIHTMVDLAPK